MEKLKERFDKIKQFYRTKERMPSYAEMMELFGVRSKNAVFKIVNRLVAAGFLRKDDRGRLAFKSNPFYVKLLGFVRAGFPSPAEEELLDTISLDRFLINNPDSSFLLKVSGDSMIEAGIMPDDFVIVDKSLKPKSGDIVIARVDGEWTMKYLKKFGDRYVLVPANKRFKTIVPKNELYIAGVVVGVVRKYR